jgi:hypothetical protein
LQSQVVEFLLSELKHKVFWEVAAAAAYGKVQVPGGHLIEFGQIGVEHDF